MSQAYKRSHSFTSMLRWVQRVSGNPGRTPAISSKRSGLALAGTYWGGCCPQSQSGPKIAFRAASWVGAPGARAWSRGSSLQGSRLPGRHHPQRQSPRLLPAPHLQPVLLLVCRPFRRACCWRHRDSTAAAWRRSSGARAPVTQWWRASRGRRPSAPLAPLRPRGPNATQHCTTNEAPTSLQQRECCMNDTHAWQAAQGQETRCRGCAVMLPAERTCVLQVGPVLSILPERQHHYSYDTPAAAAVVVFSRRDFM